MLLFSDSMLKFNLFHVFTHTTLHSTVTVTVHCRNHFSDLSVSNTNQDDSFNLLSILNSSGLSSENAIKLKKRLKIRNPDNGPDAVVQLLRTYGFSDSQLSTLVKKRPSVLLSDAEKTLLPKLKFLQSIGVSNTDLPKIVIGNTIFLSSLEKNIIPRYHIIRSIVRDDKEVVSVFKRGTWNFYSDSMVPNIEVLRNHGVPQTSISHLVCNYSAVAFVDHSIFVEAVNSVKVLGFDPSKLNFVLALQVFVKIKKEIWESKLKIFESLGWSKGICVLAFQRYPPYILISEKKIMKTMNFLVKDMGLSPEDIARSPNILNRNLEKTIMPRCAVVNILKSRGLIKSDLLIGQKLD
ncbi:hypothetical protein TSUD_131620 [Trifolium subterraneum]|uniref:Uncharacterized protein n=1 Tax=Trifolium subterraneum TaxID=3900 RepID=A0A2Z6P2G1_TRISU|nr:hypothetical protein TSUD_131620 [Trifolium subterraneum]